MLIKLMLDTCLNWISVNDRIFYLAMDFIFKIIHSETPTNFNQFITTYTKFTHTLHNDPFFKSELLKFFIFQNNTDILKVCNGNKTLLYW